MQAPACGKTKWHWDAILPHAIKWQSMQVNEGRREFIKTAAAIATAAFPILGANDRVNVGIVGLGGRGPRPHGVLFEAQAGLPHCRGLRRKSGGSGARHRASPQAEQL